MLGFGKNKEEKDIEKTNKFNEGIKKGWISKVQLPEIETVSRSAGTKAVATIGLGLVGFALTSSHKNKPRKIRTTVKVADKGMIIEKGTIEGKDLRLPWEAIIDADPIKKRNGNRTFINLVEGEQIILYHSPIFGLRNYHEEFNNLINEKACGVVDDGWD